MKEPMFTKAWYCIRTQPKSEHIAAAHLRILEGVEAYCPRLRFRRMTQRGPVWFAEALFPGYIFARFTPIESQLEVAAARGVSTLLRFGGELASVPDGAIEELREHMGDEDCKTIDPELRAGDAVTVTDGVFRGLSTIITQLAPSCERVRVLVEFLGECREVELSREQVLAEPAHLLALEPS